MLRALQRFSIAGLIFCLASVARASIAFDFDSGTNPPFVGQSIPLSYTADGLTAHFSSPDGQTWSVQNYDKTFFPLDHMSGNYLWPSDVFRHHLRISFDQPLTDISFTFATVEYQDQVEVPSPIQMNASSGAAPKGSTQATGRWVFPDGSGGAWPQGTLAFNSASSFDNVDIFVPFVANGAVNFVLDNVNVTPAVPEPATALVLAGVAAAMFLRPRSRPQ